MAKKIFHFNDKVLFIRVITGVTLKDLLNDNFTKNSISMKNSFKY